MTLTPRLRKVALTAHVTSSVGWFGAVAAFLALAVAGLNAVEVETVRVAYPAMAMVTWYVILPASLATLATGLISSLGTQWGLFRHYWVVIKLLLTVFAVVILCVKMPLIDRMAAAAGAVDLTPSDARMPRMELVVHATGGLVVLLVSTVLGVFKPPGLRTEGLPRWLKVSAIVAAVLTALGAIGSHVAAGGLGHH